MKYSDDFKSIALDALRGKWRTAVLTGFIASLMGACITSSGGGSSNSSSRNSSSQAIIQDFRATQFWENYGTLIMIGIALLVVWIIVTLVIGGAGKLGYATFNLNLVDHKDAALSDLFSQFHRLWDGFCMNFLTSLYLFLWSLLIIPGIVKGYSYAMTPYIMAEHPELTANEAITRSREIMDGNKWRLFCLMFSFIGWELLICTPLLVSVVLLVSRFAIGMGAVGAGTWIFLVISFLFLFVGALFLCPYQNAALAAFYRDISAENAPVLPGEIIE